MADRFVPLSGLTQPSQSSFSSPSQPSQSSRFTPINPLNGQSNQAGPGPQNSLPGLQGASQPGFNWLGLAQGGLGLGNKLTQFGQNFDSSNIGTYGSGLGALGSGLGLIGNLTKNGDLSKIGSALGLAGSGVRLGQNIATNGLNVGNIAGGAGLVGAGLGLAGSMTGNRDLSMAGNLVGTAGSLYGLGSGVATAAATPGLAASAIGGTGASLGMGATLGIAGGVLALPGIVQAALDYFAPDWVGPSHYGKTRTKEDFRAQNSLAMMNKAYDMAKSDSSLLHPALSHNFGDINTSFNGKAWRDMTPQEFQSILQSIQQDPSKLNAITGQAGSIPYLDERNKTYFANEAADYTRNLIAQRLGLPYQFTPPNERVRDYHGFSKDMPGMPNSMSPLNYDQARLTQNEYLQSMGN